MLLAMLLGSVTLMLWLIEEMRVFTSAGRAELPRALPRVLPRALPRAPPATLEEPNGLEAAGGEKATAGIIPGDRGTAGAWGAMGGGMGAQDAQDRQDAPGAWYAWYAAAAAALSSAAADVWVAPLTLGAPTAGDVRALAAARTSAGS